MNTTMSSLPYLGSLVTVISALGVSNPTITKVNTPVKTTLIIVLPAYKQDARTLQRPGVVINHQLHPVDPVSGCFMVMFVFKII